MGQPQSDTIQQSYAKNSLIYINCDSNKSIKQDLAELIHTQGYVLALNNL